MKKFLLRVWIFAAFLTVTAGITGQNAPLVTNLDPANSATAVAVDKVLSVTFDRAITPRQLPSYSPNGYIRIYDQSANIIGEFWCFNGGFYIYDEVAEDYLSVSSDIISVEGSTSLKVDLNSDFNNGLFYYVLIGNRALYSTGGTTTDYAFSGFSSSNDWGFTTISSPEIADLNPSNASINVGVDDILTVTFDQNIQFGDGPSTIFIKNYLDDTNFQSLVVWESIGATDAGLSITDNQLSITHNTFAEGTEYYVVIESGAIESTAGVVFGGISDKNTWHFTSLLPGPEVIGLNPIDGAENVALDQVLTVTFDQNIQFSDGPVAIFIKNSDDTNFESFTIWEANGATSSDLSINGNQLSITHKLFAEGASYYVLIPGNAIESLSGAPFSGFLETTDWNFTSLITAPEITSLSPANETAGVGLDAVLTVSFDQNIQFGDGPSTIFIKNYSDDTNFQSLVVWESIGATDAGLSITDNQLSITHNTFAEGTEYYVVIESGAIESTAGVVFGGISDKNTWHFTSLLPGPEVIGLNPIDGAENVALDQVLTVTFDQNIQFSDGPVAIFIKNSDDTNFESFTIWEANGATSSDLSINGNQLSITHKLFAEGASYYVLIPGNAIESLSGAPFSGFLETTDWNFTSLITAPEITSLSPANETAGVGLDAVLTVSFDQNIQFGDGPSTIFIKNYSDDTNFQSLVVWESMGATDAGLSITDNQLSITHNVFAEGTEYYVVIESGAIESTAGVVFGGISNKDSWHFTTFISGPKISNLNPVNGGTGTAVDQILVSSFDQNIQFSDGPTTIFIRNSDGTKFESFVVWEANSSTSNRLSINGSQLSINHSDFLPGLLYYIEIPNNAIESTTGIPFEGFSGSGTWSFTTVIEADPPSIIEGSLSPIPGTTEVSRNPVLSVTFNENIVIGTSGYFKIFDSSDNEIATVPRTSGMVSIVDDVLTVSLTSIALPYGADCYVVIDPGFVRSAATGVNFLGISDPAYWYFTTETAPPFWAAGYPSITSQNADNFTFNGQTDQSGDMYFVVTGTGVPAPTAEQISLGLNGSGAAAKIVFSSAMAANTPLSAEVAFNVATPQGTSYYLYAVAYSGEKAGDIIRIDIDRTAPIIEPGLSYPSNGATTVPVDAEISIVFSEMIYGYVGPGVEPIDASYFSLQASGVDVPFSFAVSANGEVVTLTPLSPLAENTAYTVTIQPIADEYGNSTSIITRTFETDKLNQWIGNGVVSDWVDPLNWSDGSFVSGKSVIVTATATAFPVIDNETVDVYNLTVEAGAAVTLSGGNLNISGVYNLQSSSSVNASFIHTSGTLTVDPANVQIDQVVSDPAVTYFFSSPVSGATPNSIQTTNVVYQFDNSTGQYSIVSGTSAFEAGRGYATRSTQPLVFSGSINQGSFDYTVNRSALGFGWNLVGNPYPASIDWTALTNTNLEDAFWIWNQDGGNYGVYNAGITTNQVTGPIIPSNQGFLVKVLLGQTEGAVGFNTVALVQNSNSYLKSAGGVVPHIKLAGINGSYRDEVAFAVSSISSYGTDRLDTEKYFSTTSGLFELYSKVGDMPTVISGYPQDELIEIPLGYKAKTAGNYTIEITKNVMPNYTVVLFDSTTGSQIDFTNGGSYDFSVESAGSDISRFKVVLSRQTTDIGSIANDDKVTLYVNDRSLFVTIESAGGNSDYQLFDINGRLMRKGLLINAETNRIDGLATGTYVLRIINNDKSVSNHKVLVY